jgi:hypothetical protein
MTDAVRETPQLYSDGFGSASNVLSMYGTVNAAGTISLWPSAGEPDLIMTGVRSFDIKAYDDLYAGYVDLGWKNDVRIGGNLPEFNMLTDNTDNTINNKKYNFLNGTPSTAYSPFAGSPFNTTSPYGGTPLAGTSWLPTMATFGHEGRMPPLTFDNRADAQYPSGYYPKYTGAGYPYLSNDLGVGIANIGDDSGNVNRLRRVFDTWSTDYTKAPAHATSAGVVYGPPLTPPVLPSYPPPYPAPLKGLQIQIRVVDPTNHRIKQVTIRHDVSDRL